jgi:hypothetical protein
MICNNKYCVPCSKWKKAHPDLAKTLTYPYYGDIGGIHVTNFKTTGEIIVSGGGGGGGCDGSLTPGSDKGNGGGGKL